MSAPNDVVQIQLRMRLRYDGRGYRGWQRQPGSTTVQGTIEAALASVTGIELRVRGSGRTDRGVHAEGQIATVTLPASLAADPAGLERFTAQLGDALPQDIGLLELDRVPLEFHPREDAIAKRYRYEIWNGGKCPRALEGRVWEVRRRLDVEAMRAALPVFVGQHDFTSFATRSNFERVSSVRKVEAFTLAMEGRRVSLNITADGFLYKMVRNIVRAVAKVGEGRCDNARLIQILEARDRAAASGSAPASGLFLDEVTYPPLPAPPA
ncbi:tRNA pseudouridine synthase A [Enhygromyxa salina]|uniref:tRNA pseudouridine synthase A n=1 Tax=Enhygromyxa salina TaxID=215803 RepID=A0A0C1ZTJ1_9BACT|nr:tRNA pseudouridine(38-40) synthase TruA [Enhygromyxa salina]KIG14378.1 tRNA pseudouridine synthase A [Enhygromyxa salina]